MLIKFASAGFPALLVVMSIICSSTVIALEAATQNTALFSDEGSTNELTINEALKRTLLQSPALQSYPYQRRIDDAATLQAGLTPNPELNISLENVLGNGSSSGIKSAELTLSLSQLIELGDKKQKRLEVSQWQSQLSQQQYQLAKVDALAATMRSFLELLLQQALQQWTLDKIAIEQQALRVAKTRAKAGAVPDADVARLELRPAPCRSALCCRAALAASP